MCIFLYMCSKAPSLNTEKNVLFNYSLGGYYNYKYLLNQES